MACLREIHGRAGMSFAKSFISAKGIPNAFPASFTAARAASVPKVHT